MTVKAIYRKGHFVPQVPVDLPEGDEVELTIAKPAGSPPDVTDPEERQRIIDEILAEMARSPWPADAPRFTREELHDRG